MRIIAGALKGRRLLAPPGRGTRPTMERVREALFSILGEVRGYRMLDLYAGSGAMGLEALSRGATWAGFVEKDKHAAEVVVRNIANLGVRERATVWTRSVASVRVSLEPLGPFDLVLADPPWPDVPRANLDVFQCVDGLLHAHALVVLGHPKGFPLTDASAAFRCVDTRHWGDSALSFFKQINVL